MLRRSQVGFLLVSAVVLALAAIASSAALAGTARPTSSHRGSACPRAVSPPALGTALAAQARTLRGAGWTLTPAAQAILKGAAPDQVLAKFGQNVTTADGTGGIGVLAYGSGKAVPALPAVGGATTGTAASLRTSRSLQSARRAAGSIWEYLYCITHETAYIEGSSGVGGVSDEWLLHNSSTQGDKDITPGGFYTCTAANAPCIVFGDWNPTFPWEVEAGRFVGTASVAIISGWCTHN